MAIELFWSKEKTIMEKGAGQSLADYWNWESVRDGAKRESREETGLEVEIGSLIDVEENITYDENGKIRFHYVLIDFLGRPVGGNLKPATDASDDLWLSLEEIGKLPVTIL